MSGFYINELLLNLLGRDDPNPRLFDHYARMVHLLADEHGELLQAALRTFELLLLHEVGLLPLLNLQTLTHTPLVADRDYVLVPDAGLRAASDQEPQALNACQWQALQAALDSDDVFASVLTCCSDGRPGRKLQLRHMLQYHCGVARLRTRQVMQDLQAL